MAPSVVSVEKTFEGSVVSKNVRVPLRSAGSLEGFGKVELTGVIGTEFAREVQLVDLLSAPNSDELIKDLALLGINPLIPVIEFSFATRSGVF